MSDGGKRTAKITKNQTEMAAAGVQFTDGGFCQTITEFDRRRKYLLLFDTKYRRSSAGDDKMRADFLWRKSNKY